MAVASRVYLDNHATTRVDPRVVEAMIPYLTNVYGNPSSRQHAFGWEAEAAVGKARASVARLVGVEPEGVIFTSGATESINLALKGIAEARGARGDHVITVSTEHRAVLDTCRRLERAGFRVTFLPVDGTGRVDPQEVKSAMTSRTILVSVMMANNEVGTLAPLAEIGALCVEAGIPFHSDVTQAAGRIPVDLSALHVDLASFSAHKMYGPKGVGALCVRLSPARLTIVPQIEGGGHERGIRSGTLNVPGIVGFGAACELALAGIEEEETKVRQLRDLLEEAILSSLEDVHINGSREHRLPNNSNMTLLGVRAEKLMLSMSDIAVSTGSACSSASPEPSYVLRAMGVSPHDVLSSVRFGLGRFTTKDEIEYTIGRVVECVKVLREQSSHHGLPSFHH